MTGIVIIVYNLETRVFILQIEAIKKFCQGEYAIEVIDNSTDEELSEAIRYYSDVYNLNYRKTSPANEDPSRSHAFAANFAYEKVKEDYDILVFFDHDLIPVKPFDPEEILGDNILAGTPQKGEKYPWPGCLFINNKLVNKDMVKFNPVLSLRYDTGGELYRIVENSKVLWLDEVGCENPHFTEGFYYFYIMIHDKTFLHFLNTSNWKKEKNNDVRVSSLISICNELINFQKK